MGIVYLLWHSEFIQGESKYEGHKNNTFSRLRKVEGFKCPHKSQGPDLLLPRIWKKIVELLPSILDCVYQWLTKYIVLCLWVVYSLLCLPGPWAAYMWMWIVICPGMSMSFDTPMPRVNLEVDQYKMDPWTHHRRIKVQNSTKTKLKKNLFSVIPVNPLDNQERDISLLRALICQSVFLQCSYKM